MKEPVCRCHQAPLLEWDDPATVHPLLDLDPNEPVYIHDFRQAPTDPMPQTYRFGLGCWNEERPEMYVTELFDDGRSRHIGLDLGGAAGTWCHAPVSAIIHSKGIEESEGSYGGWLTLRIEREEGPLWILLGHLMHEDINGLHVGMTVNGGSQLARFGYEHENGGWPPHVHVQVSLNDPGTEEAMPGVVRPDQANEAIEIHPNPILLVGEPFMSACGCKVESGEQS
ncbi:MAG TPA: hypothetical protein QF646_07035 [Candidatus Poseidoniales archaeon]|nr:hypothetical protein [Candidatus Poseidoniales archaeon]